MASPLAEHWGLAPELAFVNHGSFGATPRAVLALQAELRTQLEADPVRFLEDVAGPALRGVRGVLASFLGADVADIGLVRNATEGVNAVLRSLRLEPGDEVLVTDHAYNACRNAADFVVEQSGARLIEVRIPFLGATAEGIHESIMARVTDATRLVMIDHITSPTALVMPVAAVVSALEGRGIPVLVDGAHGPGQVPVALDALGASFYAGNAHKWLCAPKTSGFLHVRKDRQASVVPAVISHGANADLDGGSRFERQFEWPGTIDPTPALSTPAAIETVAGLVEGGWPAVMDRNHDLVVAGRTHICDMLDAAPAHADDLLGSMATIPLEWLAHDHAAVAKRHLHDTYGIQVPIVSWSGYETAMVRISAHLYNDLEDYDRLGTALRDMRAQPTYERSVKPAIT